MLRKVSSLLLQYKFHRTTPIVVLCVLIVILLSILSTEIRADELTHNFKSPSFNGQGISAHYLTIENQQKSRTDAIQEKIDSAILAAAREEDNTVMAKFMRNLESRIYAQLSKQLVENLFKQCDLMVDPTCTQAAFGSFALEGNTVSYLKTTCDTASMSGCVLGEEVIILTVVADDGTETIITIPVGNGTFG